MKRLSKSSRDIEVPASSLADIAFLLIIFFMVASLFNTSKGLRFDLPARDSKPKLVQRNELVIVELRADGAILVDGIATAETAVDGRLAALGKTAAAGSLLFRVSRRSPYGKFAALASRLRGAGYARFAIAGVD